MEVMRRLALVLLLTVACGAAAHAQTLTLNYRAGDTFTYALHLTASEIIDAGVTTIPFTVDLTASETITVKSVDSAGTADLSITLSNLTYKLSANGTANTTTSMPRPTVDIQMAADGRILSVNGRSFAGDPFTTLLGISGGFISAVLPDTAVKPGDTWSKDYDQANPPGSGTTHIATTSKYLRDQTLKGVKVAVVETTSNVSVDITIDMSKAQANSGAPPTIPYGAWQSVTIKGTMTSDVTTWVDTAGHRILKTQMTGSTNATMTIKPVSGAAQAFLTGPFSITGDETADLTPLEA